MRLSVAFHLFLDLLSCFCFESPTLAVIPVHQFMQRMVLCVFYSVFGDRMVNMGVWLLWLSELNQHDFSLLGMLHDKVTIWKTSIKDIVSSFSVAQYWLQWTMCVLDVMYVNRRSLSLNMVGWNLILTADTEWKCSNMFFRCEEYKPNFLTAIHRIASYGPWLTANWKNSGKWTVI